MTWNHRVIEHENADEKWWSIHEVYYNEDGSLLGYAESPAGVMWYEGEWPETQLRWLQKALDAPYLTEADFEKPSSQL